MIVVAAAEAETAEYGEDCSFKGLLDRRIQSLTQQSCVFLADVKDDSRSRNCFSTPILHCSFHLLL